MKYILICFTLAFCSCKQSADNNPSSHKDSSAKIKTRTEWVSTIANPTHFVKQSISLFNDKGQIIKEESYSQEKDIEAIDKTDFKYIGDKLVEEIFYDYKSKFEHKDYYDYNGLGQNVRQKYLGQNKTNSLDSLVNRFNDKGNIIRSIIYENGDSVNCITFEYNDKNQLTHKNTNIDYIPTEYFYKYENNLLVEEKGLRKKDNYIETTIYKYDDNQNLIEKILFWGNPRPAFTFNYKYEYYDCKAR